MCERVLFLNFVAIQTATSASFHYRNILHRANKESAQAVTHAILDLAAYPEYQDPLKEEIETALLASGGCNKLALAQMKKLDSILRESLRMNGIVLGTHAPFSTLQPR